MDKYIPTIILLLACFWSCDEEVQSDNYLVHNSDHVISVEDLGATIIAYHIYRRFVNL